MGRVLSDAGRGLGAAVLTVLLALVAPPAMRVPIVGVLLGVAAGVYPGFAQSGAAAGSQPAAGAAEARLQWVVALLFATIAVIGIAVSAWGLVAGWVLHAAWDARHHAGRRGDWVPRRYPMFCLTYDLGLAAFAAWLALGGSA
ncbi:MAG: hypothetical protein ACODAB_04665 [Gemmatimonadota bacterium]